MCLSSLRSLCPNKWPWGGLGVRGAWHEGRQHGHPHPGEPLRSAPPGRAARTSSIPGEPPWTVRTCPAALGSPGNSRGRAQPHVGSINLLLTFPRPLRGFKHLCCSPSPALRGRAGAWCWGEEKEPCYRAASPPDGWCERRPLLVGCSDPVPPGWGSHHTKCQCPGSTAGQAPATAERWFFWGVQAAGGHWRDPPLADGSPKPVLEDAFPGNHSKGWMSWVCKTPGQSMPVSTPDHRGSDRHPPRFAGSSRAQSGGGKGNPLAPAVLEVGADHPSGLTGRPSTSEALPAPQGLAHGLWASSALPCAMGGHARGIFGAHTRAGAHREAGDGLCWGAARDGVSGGHSHGAEPLSQQRKAGR